MRGERAPRFRACVHIFRRAQTQKVEGERRGDEHRGGEGVEEVAEDCERKKDAGRRRAQTAPPRADVDGVPREQKDEAERLRVEARDEGARVVESARRGLEAHVD